MMYYIRNTALNAEGFRAASTSENLASLDAANADFSLSIWIHPEQDTGELVCALVKSIDYFGYSVYLYNEKIYVMLRDVNAYEVFLSAPYFLNVWQHIVFVIDRTLDKAYLYVNGTLKDEKDISALNSISPLGETGKAYFRVLDSDDEYAHGVPMIGSVDDLRAYKKALTADEIKKIYNYGLGEVYAGNEESGGQASAVFSFSEGQGTATVDQIGGIELFFINGIEWKAGGIPLNITDALCFYVPNHGYEDGTKLFVSFLGSRNPFYVRAPGRDTFFISSEQAGVLITIYDFPETAGKNDYVMELSEDELHQTVSGLSYLKEETVEVATADGRSLGFYEVNQDGEILLERSEADLFVGIPYKTKIRSMRLELPNVQGLQGLIKRIHQVKVRYLRTISGQVGQEYDGQEYLQDLNAVYSEDTKDMTVHTTGGFSSEGYLVLSSKYPTPMYILCANIGFSAEEK